MTSPMNTREGLLACPFCGTIPAICVLEDSPGEILSAWVNCSCGVETRERLTEAEAIAKWNTRASGVPQPLTDDLRKLDAVVHVLGIEDSEDDPSEVCRQLLDSNEELCQAHNAMLLDSSRWQKRAEEAEAALSASAQAPLNPTKATYDQRCWDLAVVFLSDSPEKDTPTNRHELAAAIQRTIEDVIEFQFQLPSSINKCRSCQRLFKDSETCSQGGCPMGGDV